MVGKKNTTGLITANDHKRFIQPKENNIKKENVNQTNEASIIFDPSLLMPPSNILLQDLVKDHNILVTQKMQDFFVSKSKNMIPVNLKPLLKFWGGKPEEVELSYSWLNNNPIHLDFTIKKLDPSLEEFRTEHIIAQIRKYIIDNDPNLQYITDDMIQFVSDEICLALSDKTIPIFCTQTSSWKIAEILKKIGANIKTEIIEYSERKKIFFGENWKRVLSKTVGAAFIWAWGGPLAGMGALGVAGIYIAIEDP